jgi:hypothetical protein
MDAIEFRTKLRDGVIEIPRELWDRLRRHSGDEVRVIVLTAKPGTAELPGGETDLIGELLAVPLSVPDFVPLSRDEAHGRL